MGFSSRHWRLLLTRSTVRVLVGKYPIFLFQLHFTKGGMGQEGEEWGAALPLTFWHFEVAGFSSCPPNAPLHKFVQLLVSFQALKSVWGFCNAVL